MYLFGEKTADSEGARDLPHLREVRARHAEAVREGRADLRERAPLPLHSVTGVRLRRHPRELGGESFFHSSTPFPAGVGVGPCSI